MLRSFLVRLWLIHVVSVVAVMLIGGQHDLYALTFDQTVRRDKGLYLYDIRTGAIAPLVDQPDISEGQPRWSPDGARLAYMSTAYPYGIYLATPGIPPRQLYETSGPASLMTHFWTPDSESLAWVTDTYFVVVTTIDTGEVNLIDPEGAYYVSQNDFIHLNDEQVLLMASFQGDLISHLYQLDLQTEAISRFPLPGRTPPCDEPNEVAFSPDGTTLLLTCFQGANLYLIDPITGDWQTLTDTEIATLMTPPDNVRWSPGGDALITRHRHPSDGRYITHLVDPESSAFRPVMRGVNAYHVEWTPPNALEGLRR
jgi:dipeptidyl aminopeptidase/acylaminoacyl peptidase